MPLRRWNPPAKTADSGAPVRDPFRPSSLVQQRARLRRGCGVPRAVGLAYGVPRLHGVDQGRVTNRLGLGVRACVRRLQCPARGRGRVRGGVRWQRERDNGSGAGAGRIGCVLLRVGCGGCGLQRCGAGPRALGCVVRCAAVLRAVFFSFSLNKNYSSKNN